MNHVMFPTGEYTVTRTERGAFVDGRYTSGSQSTLTIVAGVQDVTGELLRDLPEGMRVDQTRVVFTTTELFAERAPAPQASGPDEPGFEPDLLEMDGRRWRVVRVSKARVFARRYRAWIEALS